jgi:23S rRNA (adenine2030-N6)-methyltransferase|tara:strand:+ start:2896 stop:3738 length:843 start_codon:yes stop_codon:yes gene_type:complete
MLSYRHSFHAGNHADVLKHTVQSLILGSLKAKDKAFVYVDTHAGAGAYDLASKEMEKTGEYLDGIQRLWQQDCPAALDAYIAVVKKLNPSGELRHYPGSPLLAAELCRSQDRLQLSELHPADFPRLESLFRGDRRIQIHKVDGYANLKALLPPVERRGVILIDPPYELHHEYSDVVNGVMDGLKRWGTGTFAIWYPVVQRTDVSFLERKFSAAGLPSTLQIELNVLPENNRFGMTGSGMIVVNPPWKLASTMDDLLPWLATALGQYADANYRLNWLVSEG